jgi:putative endonuclease
MVFQVYILYPALIDQYYIGYTGNIEDRLYCHKNSGSKATKIANDRELVYREQYDTRESANQRELEIKK